MSRMFKVLKEWFKWLIFSTIAVTIFLFAMWIMCIVVETASIIGLAVTIILLLSIALCIIDING